MPSLRNLRAVAAPFCTETQIYQFSIGKASIQAGAQNGLGWAGAGAGLGWAGLTEAVKGADDSFLNPAAAPGPAAGSGAAANHPRKRKEFSRVNFTHDD